MQMKSDVPKSPSRMGRRDLLKTAVSTGFVVALPLRGEPIQAAAGTWVPIGRAEQFQPGAPKRVVLPGGRVAFITRVNASQLSALSARCTHQGCEVGWDSARKQFLCPCHGATFTASGSNIGGPAQQPLVPVPVMQKGNQVLVNIAALPASGKGHGREEHGPDEEAERGERREKDDD
jgi:Rieske Fe-S protein